MKNLTSKLIHNYNEQTEDALEDYLYEIHKITLEDLENFTYRFNNVKFKCFHRVQYRESRDEHYYYNGVCFMSVERGLFENKVHRHWRKCN